MSEVRSDTTIHPFTYQTLPDALKHYPQWCLWTRRWLPEKQKWTKQPLRIDGIPASIRKPNDWARFEDALYAWQLGIGDGIGFIFTDDDPFVFLDLDHVLNGSQWRDDVLQILPQFPTWSEWSQSGQGVHLIGTGDLDASRIDHTRGIELYRGQRFVALTGWQLNGHVSPIANVQTGINYITASIDAGRQHTETPDCPDPEPPVDISHLKYDLQQFLQHGDATAWAGDRSRALMSAATTLYAKGHTDAQVLGTLWHHCAHIAQEHRPHGNALEWLWKYNVAPARGAAPPDASTLFGQVIPAAGTQDLDALLTRTQELSLGSRNDPDTIGLARTILFDTLKLDSASAIAVADGVRLAMGWTKSELKDVLKEIQKGAKSLQNHDFKDIYDSFVYVGTQNIFLDIVRNDIYRPEGFAAMHRHLGEDFREGALLRDGVRKVARLDFYPGQPSLIDHHGTLIWNTWTGLTTAGFPGSIDPWWQHLCLLIPDATERDHFLNYLAFTLQRPDTKINHCMVFCGSQGIGKDTLLWPITMALGRHYKAIGTDALDREFNAYLLNCKLLVVQEADLGGRRNERQLSNKMKPLIASPPDTLSVNQKGIPEVEIRNVVQTVLFSNEDHAAAVAGDDRRHFVIRSDLVVTNAAGYPLPGWANYFSGLWAWMDTHQGWQAVVHFLLNRDLTAFNPKAPPPMTKAKQELQETGRHALDIVLQDAIDSAVGPFTGDLVTPQAVVAWLNGEGLALARSHGVRDEVSVRRIGASLKRLRAAQLDQRPRIGGARCRVWSISGDLGRYREKSNREIGELLSHQESGEPDFSGAFGPT